MASSPGTITPAIICTPNLLARSGVYVEDVPTLSPWVPSGMRVSSVLDEEPSNKARWNTAYPPRTYFLAQMDAADGLSGDVGVVAIVNHNLPVGGQFRVTDGAPTVSERAPSSIQSIGNWTGVVTSIDESMVSPSTADYMTSDVTQPDSLRIRFATPVSSPVTGAGKQYFLLYAAKRDADTHLQIEAYLYQNGVDQGVSWGTGDEDIFLVNAHPDGVYLVLPWDASVLDTASGANVELRIDTRSTSGSPVSFMYLYAAAWFAETASPTNDSGWITVPESVSVEAQESPSPTKTAYYQPATAWSEVEELRVYFRAAPGVLAVAGDGPDPANAPPGYVDVGVIAAGPTIDMDLLSGSLKYGVETQRRGGRTEGGGSFGADAFSMRWAEGEFALTRAEMDTLMDRLDWRKGQSAPFFVAMEPGLTGAQQKFTAFWANLDRASDPRIVGDQHDDAQKMWKKRYRFMERL